MMTSEKITKLHEISLQMIGENVSAGACYYVLCFSLAIIESIKMISWTVVSGVLIKLETLSATDLTFLLRSN